MAEIIADNYGWKTSAPEHSHKYLLNGIANFLPPHRDASLLDIGTGNGASLPIWIKKGLQVSAMEPDEEGFEFAKRHENVDLRKLGVGTELPGDWCEFFDLAVSMEVIEHLFDPDQLAITCYAALKVGGIAIITTPYHGYWKNLALAFSNKWDFHHHPLRVGGHIKFWSKDTLSTLFEKHGFEFVGFKGVGRVPFLWKSMVIAFRKK